MKAFKKEMIQLLVEYTGRPELFKRIKFVDINPYLASQLHHGFSHSEIEAKAKSKGYWLHTNDGTLGNYSSAEDIIFIKTPTNTYERKCLMPETYAQTLNVILHEVCHRLQHKRAGAFCIPEGKETTHGIEFKKACLELGLIPNREAYDESTLIEHNTDADEIYQWMAVAGAKHLLSALEIE